MTTAAFQTKAEQETLAATAAALAAGKDPFGDDDDDTTPVAEEGAGADADDANDETDPPADGAGKEGEGAANADEDPDAATNPNSDETPLDADALAALAADDDEIVEPVRERRFNAADPAKLDADRSALLTEKAANLKSLMDGTIEPEAYSTKEAEIQGKLDELLVQRTLHQANEQTAQQQNDATLQTIIATAKKTDGLDYNTDPTAAKQFDTALATLAADPDNAKKSYSQLANDAHKVVLAIRGIAKPAPKTDPVTPKPTPAAARENGKGPATLRSVPAASTPNTGGGLAEQMGSLTGQAYEEAFAKLSPAQRSQLLGE